MRPTLLTMLAASVALFASAACDSRSSAGMGAQDDDVVIASAQRSAGPKAQLLERIKNAPWETLYQGERRIEQHWKFGDDRYDLVYRERVSADGTGKFAIQPLDVIAPQMSVGEATLFGLLSQSREAFSYRFRDFVIHDVAAFVRNYQVTDAPAVVTVLDRKCSLLTVRRILDPQVIYRAWVDLDTGLILRYREETRDGVLLGSLEYETLDFSPDVSQVAWHQPLSDEQPITAPLPGAVQPGTGNSVQAPRTLEGGYVLLRASQLSNSSLGYSTTFQQYTYTDGLELVFLIYGGATTPSTDDEVKLHPSVGPWQIADGNIRGQQLTAMGRVSQGDLLDLITSTFY